MSVKITDEQADQIIDALWAGVAPPISAVETPIVRLSLRKSVRLAYERALNPKPAEPEIPVSVGMVNAGQLELMHTRCEGWGEASRVAQATYRAMEVQRRKEESGAALRRVNRRSGKERRVSEDPTCNRMRRVYFRRKSDQ